jgi:hypothetical protein
MSSTAGRLKTLLELGLVAASIPASVLSLARGLPLIAIVVAVLLGIMAAEEAWLQRRRRRTGKRAHVRRVIGLTSGFAASLVVLLVVVLLVSGQAHLAPAPVPSGHALPSIVPIPSSAGSPTGIVPSRTDTPTAAPSPSTTLPTLSPLRPSTTAAPAEPALAVAHGILCDGVPGETRTGRDVIVKCTNWPPGIEVFVSEGSQQGTRLGHVNAAENTGPLEFSLDFTTVYRSWPPNTKTITAMVWDSVGHSDPITFAIRR